MPDPKSDDLEKAFWANTTLENYVRIRQENPQHKLNIPLGPNGLWQLEANHESFEKFGINIVNFASALEGDEKGFDRCCIDIGRALIDYKNYKKTNVYAGRSARDAVIFGKKIPPSFVKFLTFELLKSANRNNMVISTSFVLVIGEFFELRESEYYQNVAKMQNKARAVNIAIELIDRGEDYSKRRVALELGVSPSTVSRWFMDNRPMSDFKSEVAFALKVRDAKASD